MHIIYAIAIGLLVAMFILITHQLSITKSRLQCIPQLESLEKIIKDQQELILRIEKTRDGALELLQQRHVTIK